MSVVTLLQEDGINVRDWLQNLASFTGQAYKKLCTQGLNLPAMLQVRPPHASALLRPSQLSSILLVRGSQQVLYVSHCPKHALALARVCLSGQPVLRRVLEALCSKPRASSACWSSAAATADAQPDIAPGCGSNLLWSREAGACCVLHRPGSAGPQPPLTLPVLSATPAMPARVHAMSVHSHRGEDWH